MSKLLELPSESSKKAAGKLSARRPRNRSNVFVLLLFPRGILTSLLPALRMHGGSGLLVLMNFKAPLAGEITFLWFYLFIDLLPSKAQGEKEARRQKGGRRRSRRGWEMSTGSIPAATV